jgi:hypothetical protein
MAPKQANALEPGFKDMAQGKNLASALGSIPECSMQKLYAIKVCVVERESRQEL